MICPFFSLTSLLYLSLSRLFRAQLARRLLHETSASEDLEKSVIGKLKLKCGSHFTSKLEGMLHDLNGASDTYRKFVQWILETKKKRKKLDGATSFGRREAASSSAGSNQDDEQEKGGEGESEEGKEMESSVSGEGGDNKIKDLFDNVSAITAGQRHHQRGGGVSSGIAVVEGVEFSVQILTTGHWPTYPSKLLDLFSFLDSCVYCVYARALLSTPYCLYHCVH